MAHPSVLNFAQTHLTGNLGRVLEVGAQDVNGSARPLVTAEEYIGTDLMAGPRVDLVLPAEQLLETFGEASFDTVICMEMLEHAENWRECINNMKTVLKPGGILLVTTRSHGFPLHEYPSDYWRYSLDDMTEIFADFDIETLEDDPGHPGVMMLARKPLEPRSAPDLEDIQLEAVVKP